MDQLLNIQHMNLLFRWQTFHLRTIMDHLWKTGKKEELYLKGSEQ